MSESATVILADARALMLAGLRAVLGAAADLRIVAECATFPAALAAVTDRRPDVLVLDSMLCDPDGAAALARLRVASPETRVALFISVDAHWLVPDSADALVSPDIEAEELVQCVASLAARRRWPGGRNSTGGPPRSARRGGIATPLALLSFRERQVVQGVVSGKRNGEIAQEMGISEGTVKLHLHRIYVKLGVSGRLALYTKLMRAQQAGR